MAQCQRHTTIPASRYGSIRVCGALRGDAKVPPRAFPRDGNWFPRLGAGAWRMVPPYNPGCNETGFVVYNGFGQAHVRDVRTSLVMIPPGRSLHSGSLE